MRHDRTRICFTDPAARCSVAAALAFMLFFSSLQAAGVDVSGHAGPLKQLPTGVSAHIGWANRALFAVSYLWAVLASVAVVRAATPRAKSSGEKK